jgi:glycosyltransferase involved in cell wall biosynthesis
LSTAAIGRPHLLYVAFAFPPSTASSVYRGLAVPNAFAEAGWDVTVLTIDGEIWSQISGTDPELVLSIDPRIKVERISDGGAEDRANGDLRAFSRLRVNAPFLWRWMLSRRSRRLFPEDYHGLWLPVAAGAARRIHRDHQVDLVMATASPYVSFAVARELPGVPYVLDYRDAWAFHTFSGAPNFPPTSPTARLEARYLEGAEQIWFVNSAIRDEYARLYPQTAGKMRVVPNGFDPQPGHAKPEVFPTERPTFGYLGTIPHVRTPLRELMDGWAAAFGIDATGSRPAARAIIRGKLSSSGRVGPDLLAAFDEARRHGMEYEGPVSKRLVPEFYRSLDALILLLPAGKYVTGGKTSEYLATGLPIVSVHDLSNATTDMLRDYPLWFPAEELTVQGIAAASGSVPTH